ncbi:MAG: hypothetical protein J6S53_03775 [Lentisphaeria bacterium]|nr:hypothetical protein [Lentisphaeria bacterium]
MVKSLKTLSFFLFLFFVFPLFPAEKKYVFEFERSVKEGAEYELFIKLDQSSSYQFLLAGTEKKHLKNESLHIQLSAILTIGKTDPSGRMKKARLLVRSYSGRFQESTGNRSYTNKDDLAGRVYLLSFSGNKTILQAADGKTPLSPEDLFLLQGLFQDPAGNSFADLAGEKRSLVPGETFALNTENFRKGLEKRKIFCKEKDLENFCRFEGIAPFRNIRCGKFFLNIKSDKIPGYQFRYRASLFLPEKKEGGPFVSIQRDMVEFLVRNITAVNSLAAGGQISYEIKESASFIMLPLEKPLEKETLEGGFFDLLKRK